MSKAHSDVVLISGHDGGTGASPLTSLKHAGAPWELGLAETQQTLVLNGLRDRIVVQVDGQLKTGRDVVVAALLGAEEFGFATAPLVVSGCMLMRVCHLDTCPVGIATQNPELRARFTGKPEFVDALRVRRRGGPRAWPPWASAHRGGGGRGVGPGHDRGGRHWKAFGLDLTPDPRRGRGPRRRSRAPHDGPGPRAREGARPRAHRDAPETALQATGTPVARSQLPVHNVNRTVGTMLGHEVTRRHPHGLADDTIDVSLTGSAGQSLGAFLPAGITLRLYGDANDYVGKGLSGGRVVVRPDRSATLPAEHNVIAGNVIGYGATTGERFLRGKVGERFCVRNSGATAVVEGVGDHACEYMTGGTVLILGPTGRNVAAGMSGGVAYVLDLRADRVNTELVSLSPLRESDEKVVHDLLVKHRQWTDSAVAARLLADWDDVRTRFTLVLPRDYQRVLDVRAQAETEGLDPDSSQVWERIMEASRG